MTVPSTKTNVRVVLTAGAVAGVLDILAAFLVYGLRGVVPIRILQSVASGLLGPAAFQGGAGTAGLGLALHFFIATVAALVYWVASLNVAMFRRRPLLFGPASGVVVYAVMTFVVVPLSAVPKRPFVLGLALVILVVHMVCVGLPIAFVVSRFPDSA